MGFHFLNLPHHKDRIGWFFQLIRKSFLGQFSIQYRYLLIGQENLTIASKLDQAGCLKDVPGQGLTRFIGIDPGNLALALHTAFEFLLFLQNDHEDIAHMLLIVCKNHVFSYFKPAKKLVISVLVFRFLSTKRPIS